MLGIEIKWECPSCGNVIQTTSPFWTKDFRKKIQEPKACACGRKNNFKLIDFNKCQYEVVPKGYTIVKEPVVGEQE